jgi:hypothetical protein
MKRIRLSPHRASDDFHAMPYRAGRRVASKPLRYYTRTFHSADFVDTHLQFRKSIEE